MVGGAFKVISLRLLSGVPLAHQGAKSLYWTGTNSMASYCCAALAGCLAKLDSDRKLTTRLASVEC